MCGVPLLNVVFVFLILANLSIRTVVTFEITEDLSDPTAWSDSKFSVEDELMDPTGWNYDRTTKRNIGETMFTYCDSLLKGRSDNTQVKNSNEERPSLKPASDSRNNIAFVRRFINLLLDSADIKNSNVDQDILHGLFEIRINVKQYERLIKFSESRENISFGELDSILSSSIHGKNAIKEPLFEGFIDKILYVVSLTQVLLPFSLVLIGIFLLLATFMAKSLSQFILRVFLVIFFTAYIFEFYTRYKNLEIEQRVEYEKYKEMPSSCSGEQSVWGSIVSWFKSGDECVKYHKAVLIDPLYKVSPLGVLSCTFASIFTHPATMVGGAIADFSREIFGSLPLHYSWFVYLLSYMSIIFVIVMVFMYLCGGSIKFGNFLAGVTISSSKTPLIASATRLALSSPSSEHPPQQISSVNGPGNLILLEASTLKSLLTADKAAGCTNRIEELEHHVTRSKSVPAELTARSDLCELLDSERGTDLPTTDEGSSAKNEEKQKPLCRCKSLQESSLSQEAVTNEIEDSVKNE